MRAAFGAALALSLVGGAAAEEPLVFEGRIEPAARATLSSQLNGIVAEVLFTAGAAVAAGDPMIRLDPADAELDKAAAEAALAAAEAELTLARQEDERAHALGARGVSTAARSQTAAAEFRRAEAALAMARVDLDRARLAVSRTVIRAPIAGFAGPPMTAPGAFLEAEAGSPLGEIVVLDPVIVAYRVPYATRLATLATADAPSLDILLKRIELSVELPGGVEYPHRARPDHAAAMVDETDGTVVVRAILPNPEAILRPGMAVTVYSEIKPTEVEQ